MRIRPSRRAYPCHDSRLARNAATGGGDRSDRRRGEFALRGIGWFCYH